MTTMRVMTWNLWGRFQNWRERQPGIATVLREQNPDVVFLQESWADRGGVAQPEELADALGGFHAAWPQDDWRIHPRNGGASWFGNAVLSRWPVLSVERHWLHRLDAGVPHRHVTFAVLDSPWGPWPVASTHFEYLFDASEQRLLNAEELMHLVARYQGERRDAERRLPVIVGGDLNAVPDSDEMGLLTGRRPGVRGVVFSDVWEIVGDGGRLGAQGVTWDPRNPYLSDTAWPNRRLDYLLVSWPRPKPIGNPVRVWVAGDQPVDGIHPSDHFAVVADIRVGTPAVRSATE